MQPIVSFFIKIRVLVSNRTVPAVYRIETPMLNCVAYGQY